MEFDLSVPDRCLFIYSVPALLNVIDVMTDTRRQNGAADKMHVISTAKTDFLRF